MQIQASNHEPQEIKCTFVDHFLVTMPIPVVFFYHRTIPSELIIESMRSVLSNFPIFAGTFLFRDDQLFIDCNNQGVRVKIVHSPARMLDRFQKGSYVDPLYPKKKGSPVLSVQLNYFADGMAIGFVWNHALGDMATFMAFLKALSACAKNQSYSSPLILKNRDDVTQGKKECGEGQLKQMNLFDTLRLLKEVITPQKNTQIYFDAEEVDRLRNSLCHDLGYKISRNTAICAHLFETLSRAEAGRKSATIAINFRSHLKVVPNSLGNFVTSAMISLEHSPFLQTIAASIHESITNFKPDFFDLTTLIEKVGGPRKIRRLIPKFLLPQAKNLLTSNWTNFGAFSIDFGVEAPFLSLPIGKSPLPWVMNIIEGINNQGLLISLCLPSAATRRLLHPQHIHHLHRFRSHSEPALPEQLKSVFI